MMIGAGMDGGGLDGAGLEIAVGSNGSDPSRTSSATVPPTSPLPEKPLPVP